jgi:8-hydroxy-5-deazaflavin:NADPH oxidoreductase
MKVAILGGTGPFGRALAVRLAAEGDDVIIGSRDAARAQEVASELGCRGDRNDVAVGGSELVVLAVNADVAVETARALRESIRSPLLSVASALEFVAGGARPAVAERSLAEEVAALVDVPVAAGLHSLGARKLAAERPDEDTFVCGDDADAKALALDLAGRLVAGRALDAGPLAAARALEGMTAVLVNINRRHKAHAGLRVTGLKH